MLFTGINKDTQKINKKYPDIVEMLERTTSLEQRAVSFKIKNGMFEKDLKNGY